MSKETASDASGGKFYDLSEIPFEPTGAVADKYPYVAPKKFSEVEMTIDEVVREKKLYVVLFRAPQGGGKTATATELRRRVLERKYAGGKGVFIMNKLIDLNFAHYAEDFIREAEPLMPEFEWDKYKGKTSPGELKNAVSSVLKRLGSEYKLIVWAIDEFDILVDYPKGEQSQFLQILREIVDDLSNERLPVLFIMSHTIKSSKEFEKYLKSIHGPLQSRVVASLDIGYTFSEVRAIIAARLRSVREKEMTYNSIEPFTDESLRDLYNLIQITGGTTELNDFRFFERCCYFAMLNGARSKLRVIGSEAMKKEFQEQYKSWAKNEEGENLSLSLRTERTTLLASTQMNRNDAVLKGLVKGLKLMRDQFPEITGVFTRYIEKLPSGVHMSTLEFSVTHKPTGKKISSIWMIAAKEDGIILQDDLKAVDLAIPKALTKTPTYANVSFLSYVSDLTLDSSKITNCDQVIRISPETMRDLVGLSIDLATEDDVELLRKSFDSEIGWIVRKVFDESTRDITKEVSPTVQRLVVALNIASTAGRKLSKDGLKEEEKKLYGSGSKVADKHVSDLITLGFASEQGTQLVPSEPKALGHLEDMLRKDGFVKLDRVQVEFGPNADSVLEIAKSLGMITVEEDRVSKKSSQIVKEVEEEVQAFKPLLTEDVRKTFDGEKSTQIIKAAEKASPETILGTIVLNAVKELLPPLEHSLRSGRQVTLSRPTDQGSSPATQQSASRMQLTQSIAAQPSKVEEAILSILKEKEPLTVEELKKQLSERGFPTDISTQIFKMVIANKVRLSV